MLCFLFPELVFSICNMLNYFPVIIKLEFKKIGIKRREGMKEREKKKPALPSDYPFCSPVLAARAQVTPPGPMAALFCE